MDTIEYKEETILIQKSPTQNQMKITSFEEHKGNEISSGNYTMEVVVVILLLVVISFLIFFIYKQVLNRKMPKNEDVEKDELNRELGR